ncbi:MAG: hypothetical protein P4M11_08955 [Candidatus Pacebacteria bacterium]|nr:hypothetical protein [Candidatus Paceibacterota bacterium]
MALNITDATWECIQSRKEFCFILAPIAFVSVLAPIIFSLYDLSQPRRTSAVGKFTGLLYALFLFQGVLVMRFAQGSPGDGKYADVMLFYLGFILLIMFSIVFIADFVKMYTEFSWGWKVSRYAVAGLVCVTTMAISIVNPNQDTKYILNIVWLLTTTLGIGASLVVARLWGSHRDVPQALIILSGSTYLFWALFIWVYLLGRKGSATVEEYTPAIVLTLVLILHLAYSIVSMFIQDPMEAAARFIPGFGCNIKSDVESEHTDE